MEYSRKLYSPNNTITSRGHCKCGRFAPGFWLRFRSLFELARFFSLPLSLSPSLSLSLFLLRDRSWLSRSLLSTVCPAASSAALAKSTPLPSLSLPGSGSNSVSPLTGSTSQAHPSAPAIPLSGHDTCITVPFRRASTASTLVRGLSFTPTGRDRPGRKSQPLCSSTSRMTRHLCNHTAYSIPQPDGPTTGRQ